MMYFWIQKRVISIGLVVKSETFLWKIFYNGIICRKLQKIIKKSRTKLSKETVRSRFRRKMHESIFLLISDGNLKPVLEKRTKTRIQQKELRQTVLRSKNVITPTYEQKKSYKYLIY